MKTLLAAAVAAALIAGPAFAQTAAPSPSTDPNAQDAAPSTSDASTPVGAANGATSMPKKMPMHHARRASAKSMGHKHMAKRVAMKKMAPSHNTTK